MDKPMPGLMNIKVPAGGNIVAHGTTHRIFLKKKGEKMWTLRVFDSPRISKDVEVNFKITERGVEDI